ncbi:hypothetical protein OKW98_18515 [Pseudomonas sp. KU26590]|uniref:hypothetical protein n=1 Tax=Pseudomonas sp. KU26590 TaxID=2991051 RepID=UPI00223DD21F|nr:hypothetical protein [Pseudomonas sp. KU26590]UZJ58571.1 hypothetical protein OKW98_18515 [Pseudomonas sp. KU26590]
MIPNAENYNGDTKNAQQLIERIGKSQTWIAKRLGVSDRRIRYIIKGSRIVNGVDTDVRMTYTEQFTLECLAVAVESAAGLSA